MADLFKHIAFINDPDNWPKYPFLPVLKRVRGDDGIEDIDKRIHGVIYIK